MSTLSVEMISREQYFDRFAEIALNPTRGIPPSRARFLPGTRLDPARAVIRKRMRMFPAAAPSIVPAEHRLGRGAGEQSVHRARLDRARVDRRGMHERRRPPPHPRGPPPATRAGPRAGHAPADPL